jgi:acyl-coenzyme A synthetase/AMP-(fatty) acid ligase
MNVAHLLTSQAAQRPDAPAIIEGVGQGRGRMRVTFAELETLSSRCARFLTDAGVNAGDHVLVFVPMSIDLYLALIAIFRIGAVATFLDPSAGAHHIDRCCAMVNPKAMIAVTKAHLLRLTSAALRRIPLKFALSWPVPGAVSWSRADQSAADSMIFDCADDDPALITFTSGSTGVPKAAVRSHGFLAAQHAALARAIELNCENDIDLATLPIFSLANLAAGVTTVIPDCDLRHPGEIDVPPVLMQIAKLAVNRTVASPALLERLLEGTRDRSHALASLRRVYTGGAPVFPGLIERLQRAMPQARIVAVYGSTEAEPIAHVACDEVSGEDLKAMFTGSGLLAGPPVNDIALRIIPNRWGKPIAAMTVGDFQQLSLSTSQPGEIVVHGNHVLRGYLGGHGDEQTKFRVDNQIWHRTGDAGYPDDRGRLWLLGRAEARIDDDRGTIYPFAVECAASRVGGVARSALVQHEGKRVLIVQPAPGAPTDVEKHVRSALEWAKLDQVRLMRRIPMDKRHNAKVDYPALREAMK